MVGMKECFSPCLILYSRGAFDVLLRIKGDITYLDR